MKIISRNVNGLRAVMKKGFLEFFENENPDIFCIQETKSFINQIPEDLLYFLKKNGYNYGRHDGQRPGYSGTAIFFKKKIGNQSVEFLPLEEIKNNEILNQDGRITGVSVGNTEILNIYFPNGGTRADGTEMLSYKLKFYDELIKYCNQILTKGKDMIICGDFNICHEEIDIARPEANQNSIGFLPIERKKFSEFLNNGYIDIFRNSFPNLSNQYTRWSYRAGARVRNVGRRLDYFVCNENFLSKIKKVKNLTEIMGSDHCPIFLEI